MGALFLFVGVTMRTPYDRAQLTRPPAHGASFMPWPLFRTTLIAGAVAVLGLLLPLAVFAQTEICSEPSPDETADDLDSLFALHDYVFAARVDRVTRRGVLAGEEVREEAELFVYQPTLKGSVPERLSFDRNEACAVQFTEGAVYLLFLNDLTDTPFRSEARLMLASERGPAVTWLFDWLEMRQAQPPAIASAAPAPLEDIDDLLWTYRVLLLDASIGEEPVTSLASVRRELRERDVLWFVLGSEELSSNYSGDIGARLVAELRNRLQGSNAAVALIGKDGGLKLRADQLDVEEILARIDSMPMRRQEMRTPTQ